MRQCGFIVTFFFWYYDPFLCSQYFFFVCVKLGWESQKNKQFIACTYLGNVLSANALYYAVQSFPAYLQMVTPCSRTANWQCLNTQSATKYRWRTMPGKHVASLSGCAVLRGAPAVVICYLLTERSSPNLTITFNSSYLCTFTDP